MSVDLTTVTPISFVSSMGLVCEDTPYGYDGAKIAGALFYARREIQRRIGELPGQWPAGSTARARALVWLQVIDEARIAIASVQDQFGNNGRIPDVPSFAALAAACNTIIGGAPSVYNLTRTTDVCPVCPYVVSDITTLRTACFASAPQ